MAGFRRSVTRLRWSFARTFIEGHVGKFFGSVNDLVCLLPESAATELEPESA
jgi:hypothetical protein